MPDDSSPLLDIDPASPDPVIEGEIIEPVAATSEPAGSHTLDLTGLINNYLSQIEVTHTDIAQLQEMLNSVYENDPTYQQHDAAVKEASKIRSQTKKQIQKQPQVSDIVTRLADHKSHLKELRTQLSEYLQDYARTTGSTQFEDHTGQIRQIVYTAKLVIKS